MFGRLANFIARHYKGIIIAWILLLILAVPLAPKAFEIVQYEETEMVPADIESERAQRFIDEHFPSTAGQGSTIIVLTGSDVLSNETKSIVYDIEHRMFDEAHGGGIDGQVRVDSLYSTMELYAAGFLLQISPAYASAYNLTNLTAFALFGIPTEFRDSWFQANASAFIVYGIPSAHLEIWKYQRAANPLGLIDEVDMLAYNGTIDALQHHPIMSAMDVELRMTAMSWFDAYALVWNMTSGDPALTSLPDQRAELTIQNAFPPFLAVAPSEVRPLLEATYLGFSMITYDNYGALSAFSRLWFSSGLNSTLAAYPEGERAFVLSYFEAFYERWVAPSSLPSEDEFRLMVQASLEELSSSIGGEAGELLFLTYDSLGWDDWNNGSAVSELSVAIVAASSRAESWVVSLVRDMPPDSSFFDFLEEGKRLVRDYPIRAFPIPILNDLVAMFVNLPLNDTMLISLTYTSAEGDGDLGQASVGVVRDVLREALSGHPGTGSFVTGSDAIGVDLENSTWADIERIDPVTIVLILVLIGLFFRSPVASSVPPAVIGVALGMSFAAIFIVGSYLFSVHYSVLTLIVTSMMGAGCDYCIFILSRYREERRNGLTKEESVKTAVTWAGESIATSGATVMIGFGVLSLGRYAMLKSMGISLALGIGIALVAALTLLPAVLMLLGDRIFWPSKNKPARRPKRTGTGYFSRSAKFAIRHAKAIIVAAVLVSVPATYLALTLETSYDFIGAMPNTESKQGLDVMGEGFGAGRIMATYIALNMTYPVIEGGVFNTAELNAIENLSGELSALANVEEVKSPTRPLGEEEPIDYLNLSSYSEEQAAHYRSLMTGMVGGEDRKAVLITVVFREEPFSKASIDSIDAIRAICDDFETGDLVEEVFVGGSTASMSDISAMVQSDFGAMEVIVVVGIYVVLMIVLGSLVSPLRSILTILLSICWTIAVTMVIFNFILGYPILWLMPMILFVVCLGLGMDYDIFITTRIREEAQKGRSDREAIVRAMKNTGGVITACGVIMAGAFGTMMLSEGALLREFGFALMFAILLDATIVRIYLVPAIMSLLGKWNWYAPGRLQRVRRVKEEGKTDESQERGR